MAAASHLISRFFGSLRPGGPSAQERRWVSDVLLPAEFDLWRAMSGPDRRHSAGVAKRVQLILGDPCPRPVLAAALLHDSGKTVSGLRTPGRVVATVLDSSLGHDDERARRWAQGRGPVRRVGEYWLHPGLGADILERRGSDPLTVTWAREHHLPADVCTLDPVIAAALRDADDD